MITIITNTIYNNSMRSSIMETLPLAEKVLEVIEEAGMLPPGYLKPIPFESGTQYPLIPGDFQNDMGIWCTPGINEWEIE